MTIPSPPLTDCNWRHGNGFTISTILTTAKNMNIVQRGSVSIGTAKNAIGYNIHSSAEMRPSSFMPSSFSALSQIGMAASANKIAKKILPPTGKGDSAYASATPGSDPKVPGANGTTKPMPAPLARKRTILSTIVCADFIGRIVYQILAYLCNLETALQLDFHQNSIDEMLYNLVKYALNKRLRK